MDERKLNDIATEVRNAFIAKPDQRECAQAGCKEVGCYYSEDNEGNIHIWCEPHFRAHMTKVNDETLQLRGENFEKLLETYRFLLPQVQ